MIYGFRHNEGSLLTEFAKAMLIKKGGERRYRRVVVNVNSVYFHFSRLPLQERHVCYLPLCSPLGNKEPHVSQEKSNKQQAPAFFLLVTKGKCYAQICPSLSSSPPRVKEPTSFTDNLNKEKNEKSPSPGWKLWASLLPAGVGRQSESHQMLPRSSVVFSNDSDPGCSSKRVQPCISVNS